MELYGFVGEPGHDLVLYLGRLLRQTGKSVVILDFTEEKELMECVPPVEEDLVSYLGLDITKRAELLWAEGEAWDLGIILLSYWYVSQNDRGFLKKLPAMKEVFLLTDFQKRNIAGARDVLKREEKISMVILRDCLYGKINRNYFEKNYFSVIRQVLKIYELPLDELDYERRIRLGYEPVQNLKGLSKEFKQLLILLTESMTGLSVKKIKLAYGKQERRGWY